MLCLCFCNKEWYIIRDSETSLIWQTSHLAFLTYNICVYVGATVTCFCYPTILLSHICHHFDLYITCEQCSELIYNFIKFIFCQKNLIYKGNFVFYLKKVLQLIFILSGCLGILLWGKKTEKMSFVKKANQNKEKPIRKWIGCNWYRPMWKRNWIRGGSQ